MGLRAIAAADNKTILEDLYGFGFPIKLTNPAQVQKDLTGFTTDIGQVIDPDTGMIVSGRLSSVGVHIQSIYDAFGDTDLPYGVTDSSKKPWLVEFDDITGVTWVYKVEQSNPDRAIGMITLLLELYEV